MSINARFSIADNAFLGHEEQVKDFERLAREGLLGHAYCFFGDEGIGKFRFAHAFAHFLERGTWHAGGKETLTDALFVECADEEASVGIDAVRAIRKFLSSTPFHSARRTVVIRDAELLTWEAESALLKIVEEPPTHALIIMVARAPEALFPPLLSRMAKVYFSRLSRAALSDILVREFEVSPREAKTLATHSFGRLGYALTKLAKKKKAGETTLTGTLESLILERWEKDVKKEAGMLAFLLSRLEAASRFNLNPRLQEKAIAYAAQVH